jgi:hypothetical protein
MNLPGRCMGCGVAVEWHGRVWRPRGSTRHHAHQCRTDRDKCGAWMPYVEERCARRPGHGFEHRTAYAMENARRKGLVA